VISNHVLTAADVGRIDSGDQRLFRGTFFTTTALSSHVPGEFIAATLRPLDRRKHARKVAIGILHCRCC
jgi:hypothetical protein